MKGDIIMKRFLNFLIVLVLFLGLSGVVHAYSINYNYIAVGNEFTSHYYATTENFNDSSLEWTWTGNYALVTGSLSGAYSAPAGVDGVTKDITQYVTVPVLGTTGGNGSVTVTGLPDSNYFGLWWGSMDTYNTLTFYYNGVATGESFTGSQVTNGGLANGAQTGPVTNHYVNFLDLTTFNSFKMSSTQFAFEADNIAIAYNPTLTPVPPAILLLGSGLIGLLTVRRKFKK